MTNFQRKGILSNSKVGKDFEALAYAYFIKIGSLSNLMPSYAVPLGTGDAKKNHRFDFGSEESKVLIECKSHNWTITGNIPSAKLTVWNEAMYYFHLAPSVYQKIFFVLEARHSRRRETLAEYYVHTNQHLIPRDVSIIEYDTISNTANYVKRGFAL